MPWSAGRPGAGVPVTSRCLRPVLGALMLRTSGIRCPGSGHRHIYGAEGVPQTGVPARVCTGTVHRPERDRGVSTNLQAKPPGSWSAARGRRVAVTGRISHAHGHRRPGKQLRHRDLLRGSRRRPAGGADPRVPAQRPGLGQAGPGPAGGRVPGHHLRPARVRQVQPAGRWRRLRYLRRRPEHADGVPGPARRRAGRALDGHRRGHPLPGPLRVGAGGQGGASGPDPALPAAGRRQPRRGAAQPVRRVRRRPPGPIPRPG